MNGVTPADQASVLSEMGEMATTAGQFQFADEAFTAALAMSVVNLFTSRPIWVARWPTSRCPRC